MIFYSSTSFRFAFLSAILEYCILVVYECIGVLGAMNGVTCAVSGILPFRRDVMSGKRDDGVFVVS